MSWKIKKQMQHFLLVLSQPGDKFFCYRIIEERAFPVEIIDDVPPATIRDARQCITRHDTHEFIKCYLHESDKISTDSKYELYEIKEAKLRISLGHEVVKTKNKNAEIRKLSSTHQVKYEQKKPREILHYIDNRHQLFQENVRKGQRYAQMGWYNPGLLLLLMEYLFHKFKNLLANTALGQRINMQHDHFCEEFDEGLRNPEECRSISV